MSVYIVVVLYEHRDGRTVEALAGVTAPDEMEAISMAAEAVGAYPHCVRPLCGRCEALPEYITEAEAIAALTAALAPEDIVTHGARPHAATVH